MTRLSQFTLRNFLILVHDGLATAFALLASFYLRFDGGLLTDRVPQLLRILPWFVLFSIVVSYLCNLTTAKWRFTSLPDALNILRVAVVLTLALVVLDYVYFFTGASSHSHVFLGRITIILFFFLEVFALSALRLG